MRSGGRYPGVLWLLLALLAGAPLHAESPRDPTRPYSVAAPVAADAPRFRVNAIITSNERRLAIVNGKRVGIGDTVGGASVVSIEKGRLVLDMEGRQFALTLNRRTTGQ